MTAWIPAALAVVALVACGSDDRARTVALAESAVGVVAGGCSLTASVGSGVVVESEGHVATVAHTLRGADVVTVVDASGGEHEATVVAFDKDSDLAILEVPTLEAPALPIGAVELGEATVLVWDRNDGASVESVEVTKRLAITIVDIYVEDIVDRTGLELAGPIEIGYSGGGVVTGDGEVIGIVYANSREREGVGFATDSAELRDVFSQRSPSRVPNGRCP